MPRSTAWRPPDSRPPAIRRLEGGAACDLLVVGGGILGLSTALHAAQKGCDVLVAEAGAIGSGASGLNGGQVIPGLKYDPEWLLQHFGAEEGERIVRFAASTADKVFDLIEKHRLAVPHVRNGWIQAAHTETALAAAAERNRQWQARGADVALLGREEVERLTGARGYVGGWLDRRAGAIDPLAYTLELARAAGEAGAAIAENQRVTGLRQADGGWQARTAAGLDIRARSVVIATNAYSDDLVPGLARTVVPLHSFQIATGPLPASLAETILPMGTPVSDSRRILVYYRKSADGRFVLGGRGRMGAPRVERDWAHLERAALRLYPALSGVGIEHRWFGRVAMTPDHLPHLHAPAPGLLAVVGCQGRGVGLMTAMGERLAAYCAEGDRGTLPLPVTPIRPIPFHRFRRLGIAAAIAWYRMRDALER